MKKTYISPRTALNNISTVCLQAASPVGTTVKEGNASEEQDVLSRQDRRRSVWDDEEEDF